MLPPLRFRSRSARVGKVGWQTHAPGSGRTMSIQGGLHRAVERAEALDATALQVFVKSARQWNGRPLREDEINAYRGGRGTQPAWPSHTLAHASYLLNLASAGRRVVAFARSRPCATRSAAVQRWEFPTSCCTPAHTSGPAKKRAWPGSPAAWSKRWRKGSPVRLHEPEVLLEVTAGPGQQPRTSLRTVAVHPRRQFGVGTVGCLPRYVSRPCRGIRHSRALGFS